MGNMRGNVIFFVLIGVALFAALSFAVTQGWGRGSSTTTQEQSRIYATELLEYGNGLRSAIDQFLLLNNITDTNTAANGILFSAVGADAAYGTPGAQARTELFNTAGGKAIYQIPSAAACNSACAYEFSGQYTVTDVGTNARSELVMLVIDVTADVCTRLNATAGTGWATIPTAPALTLTRFNGTNYGDLGGANPITLTGGANEFVGKRAFCFREATAGQRYIYLNVLRAR